MSKTIGLVSLGCDKNTVDSEFILGALEKLGYKVTNKVLEAQIIIVNTCGFIEDAKQESIDTLLEMAQYKSKGQCQYLIAAGCLAQRYKGQLMEAMPELDALVGTGDFHKIGEVIDKLETSKVNMTQNYSFIDYDLPHRKRIYKHFAFVKIAEGCDKTCSYCAIPQIRGPYKSRPITSIKKEVAGLVEEGVKEIILVAQDTTYYGFDTYGKPYLAKLLKELVDIEGDFLLRLLYTYPSHIDDELLDTISSSGKIAKYLDIPLQHISPRILKLMRRPASPRRISSLLDKIRTSYPDIALRTTFIVGFPTETPQEFQDLLNFVDHYKFERLGAFQYSREEGTYAAELKPQVPKNIMAERYKKIMELQRGISKANNKGLVGATLKVLTESFDPGRGLYIGRSERDAPLVDGTVEFTGKAEIGEFAKVKILEAKHYDLVGKTFCP